MKSLLLFSIVTTLALTSISSFAAVSCLNQARAMAVSLTAAQLPAFNGQYITKQMGSTKHLRSGEVEFNFHSSTSDNNAATFRYKIVLWEVAQSGAPSCFLTSIETTGAGD